MSSKKKIDFFSSPLEKVTNAKLTELILSTEGHFTVLVFTADGLGNSTILEVYIEDLSEHFGDNVQFILLEQAENTEAIFSHFDISQLPTLILMKDQKILSTIKGLKSKRIIKSTIEKFLF